MNNDPTIRLVRGHLHGIKELMTIVWSMITLDDLDDWTADLVSDDGDVHELFLLDLPSNEVAKHQLLTVLSDLGNDLVAEFEHNKPILLIVTDQDNYLLCVEDVPWQSLQLPSGRPSIWRPTSRFGMTG